MHLSVAADEHYVPHAATSIHSFLAHRGELGMHVHFLHREPFPPECVRELTGMVEAQGGHISFWPIDAERVAGLPGDAPFSVEMWFRIFLPDLLADLDRVLYVDADTIAVDSLEPLWRTDLGDQYVGAVTNVFQHNHLHRPAELGLAGPEVYFNSGVLLFNLATMRRDGCSRALGELALARGDELEWPDQDVLNLVLGGRRLALHPRWNCMNSTLHFPQSADVFGHETVEEARRAPGIRHFEGPADNKPWHYLCEREMRELYWEHRRRTPWPDQDLEGVTRRNAVRLYGRRGRRRVALMMRARSASPRRSA